MKSRLRMVAGLAAVLIAGVPGTAQIPNFTPVTDEALRNPKPEDWIHWRRTLDAWGYSPLDEINTRNAAGLRLVWSWALENGSQQTTPLVYDGVMYIANPGNVIQALDAAKGDLIWEYRPADTRPSPGGGGGRGGQGGGGGQNAGGAQAAPRPGGDGGGGGRSTLRNLSIYEDKIYLNTGDAHIVALNARTGAVVWDTQVADSSLGYGFTSGNIIADGKVIAGLTGCSRYKDDTCYIVALDARTGREAWRTATVARPGERGGDSWGDLPLMFRAGSDAWIPGSYDPVTRMLYWGTAQAKPWARAVRGTDGDALYSNSTLALDPGTGEMKWYFQHIPGESHDMDEVFERILIDYDGKSSVFTMGKIAVLWELDRRTGTFLSAKDLGYQTLLDIDPQTGRATYREGMIQAVGQEIHWCPSTSGFKSWRAMSYHPGTGAFYIPLNLNCETGTFGPVEQRPGGGGSGPVRRKNHFHPKSPDHIGEFLAMDLRTGNVLWRHRVRTPFNTAALTTGGGLAIAGDWDRNLYVYDAKTGTILFETRMPTSVQGYPISYAVDGKQYIAVPVGTGGASWNTLIPAELTPEKRRPTTGNGVYVFALPD